MHTWDTLCHVAIQVDKDKDVVSNLGDDVSRSEILRDRWEPKGKSFSIYYAKRKAFLSDMRVRGLRSTQ